MHVSLRIKRLRELKKLERNELAKGIVSYSHLSNIEAGRFEPSEEILKLLAKKLKVNPNYLIKHNEKDSKLEELLLLLKTNLDLLDLKKSKLLIEKINKDYPIINSVYQEVFFHLLMSYYHTKNNNMNEAIKMMETSITPCITPSYEEGLSSDFLETYYYMRAVVSFTNEDYYNSYHYFQKQLYLNKTNLMKAISSFNIALVLYKLGDAHTAIVFGKSALDLHLHERRWDKAAETDNLLGILYWEINDMVNSEKHLLNAIDIIEHYNLSYLKAKILHNMGLVYKKRNKTEKSLEYFQLSLNLKKEQDKINDLLLAYRSILNIYIELGEIEKGITVLNEAKQYCRKEYEQYHLSVIEARIKYKQKEFSVFEKLIRKAIDYYDSKEMWKEIIDIAEELADFYIDTKKYKNAAHYYKTALKAKKLIRKGGEI